MSKNITPYVFGDELVRVHQDENGEPWFVAKDVCRVLEISDHHQAVAGLDEDEAGRCIIPTSFGDKEAKTVSESGLYALIFKSRKPAAKTFRKWVTSEVLPAIRKTGRYEARTEPAGPHLENLKAVAEEIPLRPTIRAQMMHDVMQLCKADGRTDELTVLTRYVALCSVVAGQPPVAQADMADDTVSRFMSERTAPTDQDAFIVATDLYEAYCDWCRAKGETPRSQSWFGRRAGQILRKAKHQSVHYYGARLLN